MNTLQTIIWLIDDDPFYVPELKEVIEREILGSVVETFRVGSDVLSALAAGRVAKAVVLDMMIPMTAEDTRGGLPPAEGEKAPGEAIAEKLVAAGLPPRRICVISALAGRYDRGGLLALGIPAENLLPKPSLVEDIKRVLHRICPGTSA